MIFGRAIGLHLLGVMQYGQVCGFWEFLKLVRSKRMIDELKAIVDDREFVRRHGKWSHNYVKDGMEYNDWFNLHCSVCGETQRDVWGKWNYCPYCGAKMDEEEQENE